MVFLSREVEAPWNRYYSAENFELLRQRFHSSENLKPAFFFLSETLGNAKENNSTENFELLGFVQQRT